MGKLFLVPTPIGNLDDITLRAIKVLSSADIVLAEDTRTTQVLLKHLGLDKKLWSHHKFNEHAAVESVYSNDGVLILMDLGSAVMTTEMVIEAMEGRKIRMADCPLVEGAVQATICAASGMDLDSILAALQEVKTIRKF